MALKDWKLERRGKEQISYRNKKTNDVVVVLNTGSSTKSHWKFLASEGYGNHIEKEAESKSKALAYARAYMRSH